VTDDDFAALVKRAEQEARKTPGWYRIKVAALGAFGYLVVWALLLGTLGLVGLIVWALIAGGGRGSWPLLKVGLPLLAFALVIVRALWVRVEPPSGILLPAPVFPELHDTLQRIRSRVKGPRIHAVLLDGQFNAAISQVPRLGILGWHRNYLLLGLPMLLALPRREMESVLAHEFGHLSRAHGKLGTWIYRIRATWVRLLDELQRSHSLGIGVVRKFTDWYGPWFNGYSFALARANEYQADDAAARITSRQEAGDALIRVETTAGYLAEDFWPSIFARADESPVPPTHPFQALRDNRFAVEPSREEALLRAALDRATDVSDTHPSLSERLAALGVDPHVPEAAGPSAAEAFLGAKLPDALEQVDSAWMQGAAPAFEARHRQVAAARERLRALDASEAELTAEQLLERAFAIDELEGRDAAIPVFEAVLDKDATQPIARCVIGLHRLARGDEAGAGLVEAAIEAEPKLALQGALALYEHYRSREQLMKAARYRDLFERQWTERQKIEAERRHFPFQRVYVPATLSTRSLDRVREVVRDDGRVRHAWLVRKPIDLSEEPLHLLALQMKTTLRIGDDSMEIALAIADRLGLPDDIVVVVLRGENRSLTGIVKDVRDSRIL
jgi:hypothetical protein